MMKNIKRHGISIGIERVDDRFFLTLKAVGTLTHEDYTIITPMLDNALKGVKEPKIRAYIDASELEGWQLRAMWDDFKLGLKHNNEFEKVAVYGNKTWQEYASKIGNWFIAGEMQFFDDSSQAIEWLK